MIISLFVKALPAIVVAIILLPLSNTAHAQTVTVAGFAYGGSSNKAKDRFKWSHQVIEKLETSSKTHAGGMSRRVIDIAKIVKNPNVQLDIPAELRNLNDSDQALLVALVLTNETLLIEKFDSHFKIYANLQAEAMLVDYKSKTIVRSYPISVTIFDAATAPPNEERLRALISTLLIANDGKSLLDQFAQKLTTLTVPAPGSRTVQVRKAEIGEEVLKLFPQELRGGASASDALAEQFASVLSSKTGVPILPSKAGHATGVMHVRFENMNDVDVELRIPDGDYVFDIQLKRLAKIEHSKNNVGAAYIFGAFAQIALGDPQLGPPFLSSEFKNGEVSVVPAGRETADDFPAYQDAIRGLFLKFSEALVVPESKWLRTATSATDIQNQINKAKTVLESCKK